MSDLTANYGAARDDRACTTEGGAGTARDFSREHVRDLTDARQRTDAELDDMPSAPATCAPASDYPPTPTGSTTSGAGDRRPR